MWQYVAASVSEWPAKRQNVAASVSEWAAKRQNVAASVSEWSAKRQNVAARVACEAHASQSPGSSEKKLHIFIYPYYSTGPIKPTPPAGPVKPLAYARRHLPDQ
jgi:hypothetical protein